MKPFCHHLSVKERPKQFDHSLAELPKAAAKARSTATRHASFSPRTSSARHIRPPVGGLPSVKSFPRLRTDVDTQGKKHNAHPAQNLHNPCGVVQAFTLARYNLAKKHWFHSLPFQQFQALLTLFPKSFSSFPHGTCLLSVLNLYLALDEIYHPLCAPIPRNVTLGMRTVCGGLQMTNGTLALVDTLFQEVYICASTGCTSRDYNSRPEAQISMLSSSLFIRHY